MADIIDNEEIDRDTVEPEALEQHFRKKYKLLTECAVTLKKSYINKLHATISLKLAVSLSDNSIEVYQLNNTSLNKICKLSGHEKTLTEVVCDPKEEHLVYSAAQDGLVKLWDTRVSGLGNISIKRLNILSSIGRTNEIIQNRWDSQRVKTSLSYGSYSDCAGSLPGWHFVDANCFCFKPNFMLQVKFHKTQTEVLATGSLDGLINIFNVMELSEDDALTYSLNVENSVEKLSWLDEKQVACITQSNDLQFWDTQSGDLLRTFTRDKVSRSIKRSKADDCFLVDTYTSIDDTPVVLAGSYGGNGHVLRSATAAGGRLQPAALFPANRQTVRCSHYDKDRDILVTTGEAAIISVWTGSEAAENGTTFGKISQSLNKLHMNRHKPY
ncbi:WD repeat-containing protein 89 [Spodoptera frugiperda]|uniref:WD repeat-containing protein 89 n=1 Tax=Spodoptera frugiperda TaxID=7108 RepID=A0A9R0DPB3_SPOFR|nr:WD repeat-containing protein 89 [Spodoptera frugiperda]